MATLNWIVIGCAVGALVTGLTAAGYWFKASRVDFKPFTDPVLTGQISPLDHPGVWVSAVRLTIEKSGSLNASAARWTAASVILGALSTLLGSVPHGGH